MQYTLVGTEDGSNVTVFVPGRAPLVAHSTHPNFDRILEGVLANDDSVVDLFDIAATAAQKFDRLSERVTVSNGRLYLDGEEVDNSLATQVVRFIDEDVDDWKPLVNFFENVQANPNEHSREQLYDWLSKRDFTITPKGMIVAYKGVQNGEDGKYESIFTGKAIVDGEVFEGHIPNYVGAVVEMPRNEVEFNPSVGCSIGLHCGTWRYASDFSRGKVLEVHVNPRDVVSVPTDSSWEKVRTCRYTVVDVLDSPYYTAIVRDYGTEDWGDGEEYCEDCGEFILDCDCLYEGTTHTEDTSKVPTSYYGVTVGERYESTDPRRNTIFEVEGFEGDDAVGKSVTTGLARKVSLERLTSRAYKKL